MQEVYQVGKDHTGFLEKKNAIGIWSKKFVILTGLKFSVCDAEGAAATQSFEMMNVIQAENGDPLLLTVKGTADSVVLRGDRATVDHWSELCRTALEVAGRCKPRNYGLPAVDPRFNLKFVEIPVEYRHRFLSLEAAVIYWFAAVRKYGVASKLTGKFALEERVFFVGDKAMYVTKPNSEVTRCMKISMLKALCTNLTVRKPNDEIFVVIKMESPDYDLYFACPEVESLINVLQTLYRSATKGRELPVRSVNAPTDPAVDLKLTRPDDFTMAMVVPTTKGPLKKALDEYAAKHGLTLTTTGTAVKAKAVPAAVTKQSGEAQAARQSGGGGGAAVSNAAAAPAEDMLTRFLAALGMQDLDAMLHKQMVDFDVLQVMEEDDYANFGIPAAQARIIKDKISDADFVDALIAGVAPPKATSGGSKPVGSSAAKAPITLSDDDDDILAGPPQRQGTSPNNAPKAPISFADLDFDDFDIDVPVSNKSIDMKVVLDDSDDDLPLPPAKPPVKAPVGLDDI